MQGALFNFAAREVGCRCARCEAAIGEATACPILGPEGDEIGRAAVNWHVELVAATAASVHLRLVVSSKKSGRPLRIMNTIGPEHALEVATRWSGLEGGETGAMPR